MSFFTSSNRGDTSPTVAKMKLNDLPNILGKSRKSLFELHGISDADLNRDLDALRQWMKKTPHLPSNLLTDKELENILLRNKFSIEKSKEKLENYCTLRGKYLYLFDNYKDAVPSKEPLLFMPLLQLTEDYRRIIVIKLVDEENFDFKKTLCSILLMCELHLRYDYNDGFISLIDMNGMTPAILGKVSVSVLTAFLQIALKAYSARIHSIHIINTPHFINMFLNLLRPAFPTKIFNRIELHADFESFSKVFPLKYVPEDFGGNTESLKKVAAHYDEVFEDSREFFEKVLTIVSNEQLRQGEVKSEEIQGTFRQLRID